RQTMVQEFHVVCCFSCQTFQSQQVKKVNTFVCKLCGAKQSVRKEYGRGSGKDCRIHVQKLNDLRGEIDLKEEDTLESILQEDVDSHDKYYGKKYDGSEQYESLEHVEDSHHYDGNTHSINPTKEDRKSKWTSYISNPTLDEENEFTEMHEHFKQQE
ncbi:unnamed protein product, partial [Meganyctiphanes norvegica]